MIGHEEVILFWAFSLLLFPGVDTWEEMFNTQFIPTLSIMILPEIPVNDEATFSRLPSKEVDVFSAVVTPVLKDVLTPLLSIIFFWEMSLLRLRILVFSIMPGAIYVGCFLLKLIEREVRSTLLIALFVKDFS